MKLSYKKKRPIYRTIFRPVLTKIPSCLEDLQALPPYGWCESCGGEVYRLKESLCKDCLEDQEMEE